MHISLKLPCIIVLHIGMFHSLAFTLAARRFLDRKTTLGTVQAVKHKPLTTSYPSARDEKNNNSKHKHTEPRYTCLLLCTN